MVLPTLAGETVLSLQSTPLAATITVMDLFGVCNMIRQDTYRIYEPLLLVAAIYVLLTFIITRAFRIVEAQIPQRR
jgi:polar amino acid transport system permease protein